MSDLHQLVERLERAVSRLEALGGTSAVAAAVAAKPSSTAAAPSAALSPFEVAYEEIISGQLSQFAEAAVKANPKLKDIAGLLSEAFSSQRSFLRVVANYSAPTDPAVFSALLQPTAAKMEAIAALREKNRGELFNHFSVVSEGVTALAWVTEPKTPIALVDEGINSSKFYTNKIRVQFKGDEVQLGYIGAYEALLSALRDYVRNFHLTGLSWNKSASPATKDSLSAASAKQPPAGGSAPPPPPPPLPPASLFHEAPANGDNKPNTAALFAELSKGEGVTSGLKKVTKDMKNQPPASSVVVEAPKVASTVTGAKKGAVPKGTPKLAQDGNKWLVEYQTNRESDPIEISDTNIRNNVYIYGCSRCVIVVKGKVNTITLDSCEKCGVVFDSIVSNAEVVNCTSVKLQANGKVPSITIDATSGCLVYLSRDAMDVEIVSSKSSEMNVSIPTSEEGDFEEIPIPEQFVSKINGKRLETGPSQHSCG
eukprot:ANDGO_06465.mRNA.1 Adenylyl cyclase-associated protein